MEDKKTLTDILNYISPNPAEKKSIEIEQEAWRTVNAMFEETKKKLTQQIEEKDKKLNEKDKAIDEKDKAIDEKDKLIAELMKQINEIK